MIEANPQRGDVEVTLAGRRFVLRPRFAALAEIENKLGEGLIPLTRRFLDRKHGIQTLANVVRLGAMLEYGETRPSLEDVGDAILAEPDGPTKAVAAIVQFLGNALSGGRQIPNGQAAPATSRSTPLNSTALTPIPGPTIPGAG